MVTLKEYMETVNYRITEGGEYYCRAFGTDPYSLSAWNGDHDGWSFNVVFDTETQEVYMVEACDYKNQRAYRRINPDYYDEYMKDESSGRDQAWDDVNYVDLETDEDWVQKANAIVNEEDYDTRVSIPLEMSENEIFELMKQAHLEDMSLNQYVESILRNYMESVRK